MSNVITRVQIFLATTETTHQIFTELPISDRDALKQSKYLEGNCFAFRFYDETPNTYGSRKNSRYGYKSNYSPYFDSQGKQLCLKDTDPEFLEARSKKSAEFKKVLEEKAQRDQMNMNRL